MINGGRTVIGTVANDHRTAACIVSRGNSAVQLHGRSHPHAALRQLHLLAAHREKVRLTNDSYW